MQSSAVAPQTIGWNPCSVLLSVEICDIPPKALLKRGADGCPSICRVGVEEQMDAVEARGLEQRIQLDCAMLTDGLTSRMGGVMLSPRPRSVVFPYAPRCDRQHVIVLSP